MLWRMVVMAGKEVLDTRSVGMDRSSCLFVSPKDAVVDGEVRVVCVRAALSGYTDTAKVDGSGALMTVALTYSSYGIMYVSEDGINHHRSSTFCSRSKSCIGMRGHPRPFDVQRTISGIFLLIGVSRFRSSLFNDINLFDVCRKAVEAGFSFTLDVVMFE